MVFLNQKQSSLDLCNLQECQCQMEREILSPVIVCVIEALFIVGRIKIVTLYYTDDPNSMSVGLLK